MHMMNNQEARIFRGIHKKDNRQIVVQGNHFSNALKPQIYEINLGEFYKDIDGTTLL